jgi:hypothetical protein
MFGVALDSAAALGCPTDADLGSATMQREFVFWAQSDANPMFGLAMSMISHSPAPLILLAIVCLVTAAPLPAPRAGKGDPDVFLYAPCSGFFLNSVICLTFYACTFHSEVKRVQMNPLPSTTCSPLTALEIL